MTKKLYPHFNPEVHKIESKIATVRTSHHCKYNINYHIIWIPKYRKPILTGKVVEVLKAIIEGQCQEMSISNLALEIMPSFLARGKKTKTKRPVSFKTSSGKRVSFDARRKPKRRTRVSF